MSPSHKYFATGPVRPMASAGKGRGVFAITAIAAGDVVETSCTIELSIADCETVRPTAVEDYYFAHPDDEARGLVVLGLASLCNHADAPNVDTSFYHDPGLGWVVVLTANRAIGADEEITRRYACPPWFEVTP